MKAVGRKGGRAIRRRQRLHVLDDGVYRLNLPPYRLTALPPYRLTALPVLPTIFAAGTQLVLHFAHHAPGQHMLVPPHEIRDDSRLSHR